jgi:hypothetical protein
MGHVQKMKGAPIGCSCALFRGHAHKGPPTVPVRCAAGRLPGGACIAHRKPTPTAPTCPSPEIASRLGSGLLTSDWLLACGDAGCELLGKRSKPSDDPPPGAPARKPSMRGPLRARPQTGVGGRKPVALPPSVVVGCGCVAVAWCRMRMPYAVVRCTLYDVVRCQMPVRLREGGPCWPPVWGPSLLVLLRGGGGGGGHWWAERQCVCVRHST